MIRSTGRLFSKSDLDPDDERVTDVLELDWFETSKNILRKKTKGGLDLAVRKDGISGPLSDGDVVYADQDTIVIVAILPCECLVVHPAGFGEMIAVCHEIGNRHIPVYVAGDTEVVTEFEYPLYHILEKRGYSVKKETRTLYHTHTLNMAEQRTRALKVTFK